MGKSKFFGNSVTSEPKIEGVAIEPVAEEVVPTLGEELPLMAEPVVEVARLATAEDVGNAILKVVFRNGKVSQERVRVNALSDSELAVIEYPAKGDPINHGVFKLV